MVLRPYTGTYSVSDVVDYVDEFFVLAHVWRWLETMLDLLSHRSIAVPLLASVLVRGLGLFIEYQAQLSYLITTFAENDTC